MYRSTKPLRLILVVAVTTAMARGDISYRIFDEFVGKGWKDAKVHLNYYATQMRNEPMANALIIFHPSRNSKDADLAAWARCIHNELISHQHISAERIAFFTGKPEDKLTVTLWLGISTKIPDQIMKNDALHSLTIGSTVTGKPLCASK